MLPDKGWLVEARRVPSPQFACRPEDGDPAGRG
ncbi:N-acetyl-anhydromuranmyl-L-alanine amidase, partial [Salmonella enterica subsp. enterica serovar Wilhelmsburg]